MRGEWIEIRSNQQAALMHQSLPMRGEWIEISSAVWESIQTVSLPMRGEWIEIISLSPFRQRHAVSPHAGRVD